MKMTELTLHQRYVLLRDGSTPSDWINIHYKEPKDSQYMDNWNIPKTLSECTNKEIKILEQYTFHDGYWVFKPLKRKGAPPK